MRILNNLRKTLLLSAFVAVGGCSTMPDSPRSDLAGIEGMNSIEAIDVMTARGFRNVDSFSSGNTQYGIFYKAATGLCAQLTMADTRVLEARDIQTHPECG